MPPLPQHKQQQRQQQPPQPSHLQLLPPPPQQQQQQQQPLSRATAWPAAAAAATSAAAAQVTASTWRAISTLGPAPCTRQWHQQITTSPAWGVAAQTQPAPASSQARICWVPSLHCCRTSTRWASPHLPLRPSPRPLVVPQRSRAAATACPRSTLLLQQPQTASATCPSEDTYPSTTVLRARCFNGCQSCRGSPLEEKLQGLMTQPSIT